MNTSFVMSVIGADRPGLVGRLSSVIAEQGGNWLESRMEHLGGQFAGILRVQVPMEQEKKLLAALAALESEGLSVRAHKDLAPVAAITRTLAKVEVVGQDRPGIVRRISQALAQQQVNVEELLTHCESAPMSGEMMFHATAKVRLPETCTLGQLRHSLELIAADLMVDAAVMPVRSSP
jgi:glycine cleavage system regulatory protein